jgi:hypothetical protein
VIDRKWLPLVVGKIIKANTCKLMQTLTRFTVAPIEGVLTGLQHSADDTYAAMKMAPEMFNQTTFWHNLAASFDCGLHACDLVARNPFVAHNLVF